MENTARLFIIVIGFCFLLFDRICCLDFRRLF